MPSEADGVVAPAGWSAGLPIAPCAAARTDGLATLCTADGAPDPIDGVEVAPLADGRALLLFAVSPAARIHHGALFAEARARNGVVNSPPQPSSPAARP